MLFLRVLDDHDIHIRALLLLGNTSYAFNLSGTLQKDFFFGRICFLDIPFQHQALANVAPPFLSGTLEGYTKQTPKGIPNQAIEHSSKMFALLLAIIAFFTSTLAAPQVFGNTTTMALRPTAASTTSPVPTTNCISDNFVKPWIINNLVIMSPIEPTTANPAFMSFSFYDPNEELQLTTTCIAQVTDGVVQMANGGYVGCEDKTVRFQLEEDSVLLLSRWYKDPW